MSLSSYLSVYLWLFLEVVFIELLMSQNSFKAYKKIWFPELMGSSQSAGLLFLLSIFVNLVAEKKKTNLGFC